MGDQLPKDQQAYMDTIEKHVLEATNATPQEAYSFALRCWQLGYINKSVLKDCIQEIWNLRVHAFITLANAPGIPDSVYEYVSQSLQQSQDIISQALHTLDTI